MVAKTTVTKPLADVPCNPNNSNPLLGNIGAKNLEGILADAIVSNTSAMLSARTLPKYLTGARCIIKINGKLAGFAFGVSYTVNTDQDEIFGIDSYLPQEIIPRRITVNGTLSMFHIPGLGPSKAGIQSNVLSFLFNKYITIEIRDSQTDALIFLTKKAVVTTRSEDIRAGELATIQLSWKAIGWQDEKDPAYPIGHSTTSAALDQIAQVAKLL